MLVLPLPVTPRSRRVGPGAFWRLWRAVFWASLRGISGSLREFWAVLLGSLAVWLRWRPFGVFGVACLVVRRLVVLGSYMTSCEVLKAVRAASPAGIINSVVRGSGER